MNNAANQPNRVAVLTPEGRGAIAVVGVMGPQRVELVSELFHASSRKPLGDIDIDRIAFGRWGSESRGEEVVVCRREHAVEIHCHGGIAASAAIGKSLKRLGCQHQSAEEWLRHSQVDSIATEATMSLARVETERAALVLLDQLAGALAGAIRQCVSSIESEELSEASRAIEQLLGRWGVGKRLARPATVALMGPPNVGKSSLINAMVGYKRAIVFDTPGTTRDAISATTAIDGWAVTLVDTAGLRETDSELERAGIELAREVIQDADLVLMVLDAADYQPGKLPKSELDQQLDSKQILHVINKVDQQTPNALKAIEETLRESAVLTSALTGAGVEALLDRIGELTYPCDTQTGDAVPFRLRHYELLKEAHRHLADRDEREAKQALLALLGSRSADS